ncbi:hypothetical protein L6164_035432 [Bauhinia variegata]|uniref:Uncharacterized protein n=1 Tax=Bauhinia variegata TaxID=167791 RepID=A0ACB9KDZ6_BAUVA|nr:hypothetical protein L6164_035432 [Bauhinia variegata]
MVARRNLWRFAMFSLCLFFSSGQGLSQETFSSSHVFSTQLDDVPVINPTTPGSANPSPTLYPTTPQTPYTAGQNPATPMTPTNPLATPTAPTTTTPTAPTTTTPTAPTTTTPTAPTTTTPTSSGGQWCVASQTASDTALQVALDYACGYGGADCSAVQSGASCYNPNTMRDHASYAFNDYYQKNPAPTSCAFGGTATLTSNDPSNGNCKYASSKGQSNPPPTTMQSPPSPVAQTSPTMTYPGGGSTVYGSEPTESPNSATSAFYSLLLLFTVSGLWASLVANYI